MDWKIGEKAYFIDREFWMDAGPIREIHEQYCDIKGRYYTVSVRYSDMFKTEEEARAEGEKRRDAKLNKYREQVVTKEDLIKFIFHHCGRFEEYTDEEANEVGREKVREMFGFDVEE